MVSLELCLKIGFYYHCFDYCYITSMASKLKAFLLRVVNLKLHFL